MERGFIFLITKAIYDPDEPEQEQINQTHKDQIGQIQQQAQHGKQGSRLAPHPGQYQTHNTKHDTCRGNQDSNYNERPTAETHPKPDQRKSIYRAARAVINIESILRLPGSAPGTPPLTFLYNAPTLSAWVLIHRTCPSNLPMSGRRFCPPVYSKSARSPRPSPSDASRHSGQ